MSEWKEARFGDFVVFNPRVKLTKGKEYPFILMEEIEPKVKFINSSSTKVYEGSGAKFENGDTLFARITPSLENGKIAQVSKIKRAGFGSTELYVFREKPNVSDKDFIYYTVRADFFIQNAVNSYVGASGRQRADAGFIANTILKLPDLPTQHRIASILSAYDDLIENNNRRIALLEQMAEQIYKEWFVRMRFPGYQNTEFEKGVPKGWEVKSIKDFGKVVTGKTPSTSNSGYFGGKFPFIKTPDMHGNIFVLQTEETLTEDGFNSQKSQALPANSICVSCIGTGGVVSITPSVCMTNQQINSLILKNKMELEFLFFTLRGLKTMIEMFGSTGATMTNLSKGKFENLKFIKPKDEFIEKFCLSTKPILNEIKNLSQQQITLKQIRDLLLPRLISGKLKVNELREFELV